MDGAVSDGTVGSVYARLRGMAIGFEFKPGERINESALSRRLGASRTPLREALNRLVAEGFIDSRSGQGFFCRDLSPQRIAQLYEARMAIECEAARLAAIRARTLEGVFAFLDSHAQEYATCTDAARLLELDEAFHMQVCALSRNAELTRMLESVYAKIRFVRTADLRQMQSSGRATVERHREIAQVIRRGDPEAAGASMRAHIMRRCDRATEAVRLAFADLYAPVTAGPE